MKTTAAAIAIIAAIVGTLNVSASLDARRDIAYEHYDECVRSTFGMSAAGYYAEHNHLPECR